MSVGPLSEEEFESYRRSIIQKESSGNYGVVNQLGYSGAYQFGAPALVDEGLIKPEAYKRYRSNPRLSQKDFLANPDNWTIPGGQQAFLADRALQDRTFESYTARNFSTLKRIGVVGDTSNNVEVAGYLATSHLLGPGGARNLKNGDVGRDANGTTAVEYFNLGTQSVKSPSSIDFAARKQSRRPTESATGTPDNTAVTDRNNENFTSSTAGGSVANQRARQGFKKGQNNSAVAEDNSDDARAARTQDKTISVNSSKDAKTAKTAEQLDDVEINPKDNPLNDYGTYTYNLALYMLDVNDYVSFVRDPAKDQALRNANKTLIARSGGLGKDTQEEFDIDFFIDDLNISTISASPTSFGSNTNATEVDFVITEPRGVTLLERLRNQAAINFPNQNYIQAPYVLEITFKGYDETGRLRTTDIRPKYIPLRIVDLKFSIDSAGAAYKVKGIPYQQQLFSSVEQNIPINLQITAAAVGDIFTGNVEVLTEEREVTSVGGVGGGVTVKEVVQQTTVNSLSTAITNFYESITKCRQLNGENINPEADNFSEYEFQIEPEIAGAKIKTDLFDPENTPLETSKLLKHYASQVIGKVDVDSKSGVFRINAGTNIVDLINFIIVSSDYVEKNLIDEEINDETITNKSVKWFKIKPMITGVKGFDTRSNRYAFNIRYVVEPTTIHYSDFPHVQRSKPRGRGIHKEYEYLFTGLNTQVKSMKLDFNAAYYNVHTVGSSLPVNRANSSPDQQFNIGQKQFITETNQGQTVNNDETKRQKQSKDLMSSIMSDGVDLIDLDLEIIGDPDYIPTGESTYQENTAKGLLTASAFMPDGTINYDLSPPYIRVNLKTPTEYNDFTGSVDLSGGRYGSSAFSGVYQLTEIKHTFSGGEFGQKLKGFRTQIQPDSRVQDEPTVKETDEQRQKRQAEERRERNRRRAIASCGSNFNLKKNNNAGKTLIRGADTDVDKKQPPPDIAGT